MLAIILASVLVVQDDPISAAGEYVQQIIKTLPTWDKDALAQYEQPELAAVHHDLTIVLGDKLEDDVLHDVERLERDWNSLVALDDKLKYRDVI